VGRGSSGRVMGAQAYRPQRAGFLRGVLGKVGMWREVVASGGPGTLGEFEEGSDVRLGHRRIACHRLRCWPRQDDQLAQSKLVK
jgi:hypothetical protein